jgi:hypothetical protein
MIGPRFIELSALSEQYLLKSSLFRGEVIMRLLLRI